MKYLNAEGNVGTISQYEIQEVAGSLSAVKHGRRIDLTPFCRLGLIIVHLSNGNGFEIAEHCATYEDYVVVKDKHGVRYKARLVHENGSVFLKAGNNDQHPTVSEPTPSTELRNLNGNGRNNQAELIYVLALLGHFKTGDDVSYSDRIKHIYDMMGHEAGINFIVGQVLAKNNYKPICNLG